MWIKEIIEKKIEDHILAINKDSKRYPVWNLNIEVTNFKT